jgi:hypothetical protein
VKPWAVLVLLVGCSSFPNSQQIEEKLKRYDDAPTSEARVESAKDLIESVSSPSGVAEDVQAQHALEALVSRYKSRPDDAILIALDGAKVDGGVGTMVCTAYASLIREQPARAYYSDSRRSSALRRCIGISFSSEDLNAIVGDQ